MKKIIVIFLSLFVFGCSVKVTSSDAPDSLVKEDGGDQEMVSFGKFSDVYIKTVKLKDGTRCAVMYGGNKGGISCDWK